MQAHILNILALIAIFAVIGLLYWGGYMSGRKDGTAEGHATGHSAGKSAGFAEANARVRQYRDDAEQLKSLREIERREHRTALEAIMLDCDQRICLFARRANPFTADDQAVLLAISSKLQLAATTFDGLRADDHARFARTLQQNALNMVERLRVSLNAAKPAELPTSNRSVLVYGPMACGKTRNAQAIAAALGLTDIRDEWHPDISLPRINTLALTNSAAPFGLPPHIRVMSFEEAMRLVDGESLETAA
jgi:hypothetical protein